MRVIRSSSAHWLRGASRLALPSHGHYIRPRGERNRRQSQAGLSYSLSIFAEPKCPLSAPSLGSSSACIGATTIQRTFTPAMASYTYDETGHMALFFIITVLFMVLVPVTFSQISLAPSTYQVSCITRSLTTVARHLQKLKYPRPLASAPHATKSVHGSLKTRRALFSDLNSQLGVSHSTYASSYD